ncbi:hypothetical protein OPU71_17450 [Niveibacterium sp. 24ML]|uniref:hypothetical protein n=1 Tax=Niveibacterium sp. 24ML TaxID=2985512 RepID=UPI002270E3E1|nr:hypothetical protein [Niveibacterium sp. 24ML]MCX9157913.1 hypothetical protein [Niveibacterium sp. 24ML]
MDSDLNASGDKISARKSLIRIRLGQWTEGQLKKSQWEPLAGVSHREVGVAAPADLYLGYGPVAPPTGGRSATLKANAAIQSGEHTTFAIAFPDEHAPLIEQALCLMDRFGAVGGRSRNSWGSYGLVPTDGSPLSGIVPVRDWKDCLQLDWPHAVGCDTKGALIWQTKPAADWRSLMRDLAILKIALRTQFEFPNQSSDGEIHERHWLSYPIKNHSVRAWGNNARLPNSLRFKVRPTAEGKLVGVVFHMPCLPPASFAPDTAAIKSVWAKVHAFLDAPAQNLTRVKA